MAYADTAEAIGEVSDLIRARLEGEADIKTLVNRPEPPSVGVATLYLFLYEAELDPSLKNFSPDDGVAPPLWLVLKYLITSFDDVGDSDSVSAHKNLSKGLQVLQGFSFLRESPMLALPPNPERLKITFDTISSDLISKIMQGPDEKYRFSMGFQVRPVMVAAREESSYSLLVGVDYTTDPQMVVGEEKIVLPVLPSMGASISHLEPTKFEAHQTLTIFGDSLNLSSMFIRLGSVDIGATTQKPNLIKCKIDGNIAAGTVISAGNHPITVVQELPGCRYRSSSILVGALLPHLESVTILGSLVLNDGSITGEIKMTGNLLGRIGDDIVVAMFNGEKVVGVIEGKSAAIASPDVTFVVKPGQSELTVTLREENEIPPGFYLTILRVNGQQAKFSPEVELFP